MLVVELLKLVDVFLVMIAVVGARQPLSPGQLRRCANSDQVSKGHHVEVGCHRLSSGVMVAGARHIGQQGTVVMLLAVGALKPLSYKAKIATMGKH